MATMRCLDLAVAASRALPVMQDKTYIDPQKWLLNLLLAGYAVVVLKFAGVDIIQIVLDTLHIRR